MSGASPRPQSPTLILSTFTATSLEAWLTSTVALAGIAMLMMALRNEPVSAPGAAGRGTYRAAVAAAGGDATEPLDATSSLGAACRRAAGADGAARAAACPTTGPGASTRSRAAPASGTLAPRTGRHPCPGV